MNFNFDIETWIVIGLSGFLFFWYVLAGAQNRRRGVAIFRWLRDGLGELGEVPKAEWIGASNMGARLMVKKANRPFRQIDAHYLLEPTEFLPYWLISRMRGKRAEVSIRLTLRSAFKGGLEIQRSSASGANPLPDVEPVHPDFMLTCYEKEDARLFAKIKEFLADYGPIIERMNLKPKAPQVEILLRVKAILEVQPEPLFRAVQAMFQDT